MKNTQFKSIVAKDLCRPSVQSSTAVNLLFTLSMKSIGFSSLLITPGIWIFFRASQLLGELDPFAPSCRKGSGQATAFGTVIVKMYFGG